jgi:hypothetical protein
MGREDRGCPSWPFLAIMEQVERAVASRLARDASCHDSPHCPVRSDEADGVRAELDRAP